MEGESCTAVSRAEQSNSGAQRRDLWGGRGAAAGARGAFPRGVRAAAARHRWRGVPGRFSARMPLLKPSVAGQRRTGISRNPAATQARETAEKVAELMPIMLHFNM